MRTVWWAGTGQDKKRGHRIKGGRRQDKSRGAGIKREEAEDTESRAVSLLCKSGSGLLSHLVGQYHRRGRA